MKLLPNGYFSVEFSSDDLKRGLRRTSKAPRNSKALTKCNGAVGQDGVLRSIDTLTINSAIAASTDVVLNDFPFPQVFSFEQHVILCNRTSILELVNGAFVEMISGLTPYGKWNVVSAYDFLYFSNGQVAVVRNPLNAEYSIDLTAPINTAAYNYNGQIIIGICLDGMRTANDPDSPLPPTDPTNPNYPPTDPTPKGEAIIPMVRAYSEPTDGETYFTGFLLWPTESIEDEPIFVAKDETDARGWGVSETDLAAAIDSSLGKSGGTVELLTRRLGRVRVEGEEPTNDTLALSCGDWNDTKVAGAYNPTELHTLSEWNDSLYSDSWPGIYEHDFLAWETVLGYPDEPFISTGPFYHKWKNSFADSTNIQQTVQDYYATLPVFYTTPQGYDVMKSETDCDKYHILWGWGDQFIDGVEVDEWVGGGFDSKEIDIRANHTSANYIYAGCNFPSAGLDSGLFGDKSLLASVSWPAGISPVFYTWAAQKYWNEGSEPFGREQYFVSGGGMFLDDLSQFAICELHQEENELQRNEYWCDYEAEPGSMIMNGGIIKKLESHALYSDHIIRYKPRWVINDANGLQTFEADGYSTIIGDHVQRNDKAGDYTGPTLTIPSGFQLADSYSTPVYAMAQYETINKISDTVIAMLGNGPSWNHNNQGGVRECYTWLNWYNGQSNTFESNMQNIPQAQFGSFGRYQTYNVGATTYYHNVRDYDNSNKDGTVIAGRPQMRFVLKYTAF